MAIPLQYPHHHRRRAVSDAARVRCRDMTAPPLSGSTEREKQGTQMTTFTVTASDEAGTVLAGLTEILQAARGGDASTDPGTDTIAVPIRGQGATLGAVFAELARDLLAQYDAQGSGMDSVRLDGLLRSEDGYVGWGYLEGSA